MSSPYQVDVKVNIIDLDKLDNLKNELNSITSKTHPITIDASSAQKSMNSVVTVAKSGAQSIKKEFTSVYKSFGMKQNVKYNADFSSIEKQLASLEKHKESIASLSPGSSNQEQTFKTLKDDLTKISNLTKSVSKLDFSKNAEEISTVTSRIKKLKDSYNDTLGQIGDKLQPGEITDLNNIIEETGFELDRISSKLKDSFNLSQAKQEISQTKADANELIKIINEKAKLNIDLSRLDEADEKAKAIQSRLEWLSSREDDILNRSLDNFTDTQLREIGRADNNATSRVSIAQAGDVDKAKIAQTAEEVKRLINVTKEAGNLKIKLIGLDESSADAKELRAELEALENQQREMAYGLGDISTAQYDKIIKAQDDANKKYADALNNAYSKIQSPGSFDLDFSNVKTKFNSLKSASTETVNAMKQFTISYNEMQNAMQSGDMNKAIASYERYKSALKEVENQLKMNANVQNQMNDAQKQYTSAQKLEYAKRSLAMEMDVWLKDNSAAAKDFGAQIQMLQQRIRSCDATQLDGLKSEFKSLTTQAKLADKVGLSFSDRLKMQLKRYSGYISIASVFMYGTQAARSMFQNVLEVDTAMTELYRVTDLTSSQYETLYDGMVQSAKEYGATLTDVINATADWSRAGFDANQAKGLAEVTTMYEHIADLDYDEAVENLLTSYKGFESQLGEIYGDDAVSAVSYIGDILNELDNNYAVTAAGVGEGLKRSAAALDVANNSIQESAAMVAGTAEVTQDPEKAGNALKVVSMRLRGMKGELEELGEETDENVENLSKMQGQVLNLTHGKVNIFDNNGDFKSTFEILQGIAEVWNDISDTDQAELLETIAGKHRANDIASLLGNWEHVEKMVVSATNATGSASAEHAKYVDSMQGRLDALTASWQALSNSITSSDFLKGIISGIGGAVDAFDELINNVGLLPTLLTGASAVLSLSGHGFFKLVEDESKISGHRIGTVFGDSIKSSLNNIRYIVGDVFRGFSNKNTDFIFSDNIARQLQKDTVALSNLKRELDNADMSVKQAFANATPRVSESFKSYADEMNLVNMSNAEASKYISEYQENMHAMAIAQQASVKSLSNYKMHIIEYNRLAGEGGDAQRKFVQAVSSGNSSLGKYLTGLNGAKASLSGYITSAIAAKVATVGLQIAVVAAEAAISLGLSFAISAIVTAISNWINANEKLAESVEEANSSYKDQHDSLTKGKSDFENLAETYAKLSNGVDELTGKNISLMPDEYKEYQNVVNQIAEQVPSLVAGYDAQGNAILNCAGNVDTLTEAYNNLIIAQNNELLNGDGEDFKGLSDTITDFQNDYNKLQDSRNGIFAWDKKGTVASANALEDIFELPEINKNSVSKYIRDAEDVSDEIPERFSIIGQSLKQKMSDMNLELEGIATPDNAWANSEEWAEYITEVYKQYPEVARAAIKDMDSELDDISQETRTSMIAYMENAFLQDNYGNINEEMQSIVSNIVSGIDGEVIRSIVGNKTGEEAKKALTGWIDNLLSSFKGLDSDVQNKLTSAFDLSNEFTSGEISLGEYKSKLEEVSKVIDGLNVDDSIKNQLKLSLDISEVEQNYEILKNRLTSDEFSIQMNADDAENLIKGLNNSQLTAAQELVVSGEVDWKGKSPEEIMAEIDNLSKVIDAKDFTINIESESEGIEKLNSALAEARSATGLTEESITLLEGRYSNLNTVVYDSARLFQETANGVSLNAEALSEYEKAYNTEKLTEATDSLKTLKDEYSNLDKEISEARKNGDSSKLSELLGEQEDIRQKISDIAELATMYEGLASSYNEWQNTESAGNDRDMYSSVYSAMEDVKKELDQGWIDDGTMEYFQLIWGEDKWDGAGKSIQDYRDKWNTLDDTIQGTSYSIQDFFKTNEDGELTSEGIFNFFDAVGQKQKELGEDWIQYDDAGNIASFNFGVDGDKAIADALGISEELVQIFLRASQDAGFVVNFDGTYTQLADMQNAANAAVVTLKGFDKTEFEFDFSTKNLESLNTQLEEAKRILGDSSFWNQDGTFNFNAEGAKEAMQVASTLQATIDSLDNKYIGLTVEDDSFAEPLSKLQDYESKVAQLNQLKLNPQANTEEITQLESDMQGIVDYFDKLSEEQKIKLGIDGKSTDEIKASIESGEITIPTTLDLQTNMNESLEGLVDIALHDAGLDGLTDEEFKVKLGIEADKNEAKGEGEKAAQATAEAFNEGVQATIDQNLIEGLDEGQKEIAVKLVTNHPEILNGLESEEKKVAIDIIAKNNELYNFIEGIEGEKQKQIAVSLIAKNQEAFEALDEGQKEIAIKFNLSRPDILDGFDDDQREIAIKFIGQHDDVFDRLSSEEIKVGLDFAVKNQEILKELTELQMDSVIKFVVKNDEFYSFLDSLDSDEHKKIAIDLVEGNQPEFNALEEGERELVIKYFIDSPEALDKFNNLGTPDKKVVIKFIKDVDDVEDYSPEQKEAVVEFIKDVDNIDDYAPEDKTAIAKYIKDISDIDSYTPENKKAICDFIVNNKDVMAYTPEEKSAIVQYLADPSAIDSYTPEQKEAIAKFIAEHGEVDSWNPSDRNAIARFLLDNAQVEGYQPSDKYPMVNFQKDSSIPDSYTPPNPSATVTYSPDTSSLPTYFEPITRFVNYIFGGEGGGGVDGTAHVNGTAFANGTTGKAFVQGDWGTKENGVALMGELGTELLVRNGRWYTVGEDGAGFYGYKKGDIIFNADQTREIFEKGKITHGNGRGKALASGTAFSSGTGASNPWGSSGSSSSSSSKSSSSSSSSSSSDDAEEFEETLDLIEIMIDRIERAISRLDLKASSIYKKWSTRNKSLSEEISEVRNEIDLQQRAYERYLQQASNVGLDADWVYKIQNGKIDIETITDEDLNDKISQYKEW